MYHRDIFSVFLTHQLNIQVPYKWGESLLAKCNHYFIRKFDQCWVPDYATEPSLSGRLAHSGSLKNVHYLGALSRMSKLSKRAIKQEVIAVLSGPEPQRTYLEDKIIAQAKNLPYQFLIVGGKPKTMEKKQLAANVQWQSFMDADALQLAISESKIVLARSGYSTVMDLVAMGCQKVLLIPTPGQSEQEYLAARLAEKGFFLTEKQSALNLEKSIASLMGKAPISFAEPSGGKLEQVISNCLDFSNAKLK
jgi:predicted glycosyltransferase